MTQIARSSAAASAATTVRDNPVPSPALVNSFRVAAVSERLAAYVLKPQPASPTEAMDFFQLCINLARGIDFAISQNEVPTKAGELPPLLKQICRWKNDLALRAAIVVLMLSVKNACRVGWFSVEERRETFLLANEIASSLSAPVETSPGQGNLHSTISTIMTRYYPLMKMGQILTYFEVKPGYAANMVDFHLLRTTRYSLQEKIRLFIAQTDNIETSACLMSPQQANFLINGKGVERRTNLLMDTGPQLPTNVSTMVKFGTNLLQIVGQFNGHYIVVVAFMSMASSPEIPVLQDYCQSGTTIQDSDSDLIEGPSRVSLNCPISFTRIKTPVKGRSCKHLQCFDFSNFININSRRPSWRCPCCNQHVCYTDICIDQNMAKVLKEVGDNVMDVLISTDGSWRAVLESDDIVDTHNNTSSWIEERSEQQESTDRMNADPIILDLTTEDEEMDAASIDEVEDNKPLLSNLQSQAVATNSTNSSELNNTIGIDLNVDTQAANNFRSAGLLNGSAFSDGGISEPSFSNWMTSPVPTDTISPVLDRGAEGGGSVDLTTSVMQGQYVDSTVNEYGRLQPLNRQFNRAPIAVQALPASPLTPSPQQRSGTSFNSLIPNGSSLAFPAALSVTNDYRSTDIQRQLQQQQQQQQQLPFSTSHVNAYMRAAQVVGLPVSGTHPDTSQVSSGLTENQNLHLQQALNLRRPQFRSQSPSSIQAPPHFSRSSIQQGGAQPGVSHTAGTRSGQHSRVMLGAQRVAGTAAQTRQAPTVPVQVPTSRLPAGEQRVNIGGGVPVRADNLEQNWRPTGRMRGSLSGRAYSAALSQLMIQPTHEAQRARAQPQPNPNLPLPSIPPSIQAFLENSRISHVPQQQNNPITESANTNGESSTLPERSQGTS